MKRLITLAQYVLEDLGDECCTSTTRDLKTVTSRVEDEGLSFLTITLANFGKDLEKGLDRGFVAHDDYAGFRRCRGLPAFLRGFLERIFDASTGRLLDDPDVACVRAVRQFTLMWAKINLPATEARQRKAILGYIKSEKEIQDAYTVLRSRADVLARYRRMGILLWAGVLSGVDQEVHEGSIVPSHSSGSTADRLSGNRKWDQQEWTERLDKVFPIWEMLLPNLRSSGDGLAEGPTVDPPPFRQNLLTPGQERPVKVVLVPKTQKTPRVIAMEPTCMQYMQQGLLTSLTRHAQMNRTIWTMIGWTDQEPNKLLAQSASLTGSHATLDLSEASDRVHYQHVLELLRNHPHLREGVDACRSRKADVLGHGVLRLTKFASMGSALTFPLEAMVFTTVIFCAIEEELGRPLTGKDIKSFSSRVRVYGDDIIVPVRYVPAVIRWLESFGLKVNRSKSFWNGKFRESCGGDFYGGSDVSIVRLRSHLPLNRKQAAEIVSTVSLRNQLYFAGLWKTASHLDGLLTRLIPLPVVTPSSPALGRHSFLGHETQRMCPNLQRAQVRAFVVKDAIPVSKLDGYGALLKCLLPNRDLPFPDADHLQRAGRSKSVNIRLGWVNAY